MQFLAFFNSSQRSKLHSYYPWVVTAMSAMFLLYKYVVQISPAVMTQQLMQTFHLHAVGLGNLAAMYFYSYLLTQVLVGPLLDRFSTRFLTAIAIFVAGLSLALFSQADTLIWALLARAGMGVGAAFATVSYLKLAAMWHPARRFAMVAGLLATGASAGAMVGQAPLAASVAMVGWHETVALAGGAGMLLAVLFFLVVRGKPNSQFAEGSESAPAKAAWRTVLTSKTSWLLTAYSGLAWAPLAVFGGLWGVPFLTARFAVSTTHAAELVTMAFVGLAVGGPLFGWLAVRTEQTFCWMLTGLVLSCLGLASVVWLPGMTAGLAMLSLFVFGLGTGAFMLGFSLARAAYSTAMVATVVALVNSGDALLGAISEPLVGKLLDLRAVGGSTVFSVSDYQWAMLILPVYLLLAVFVLMLLKRRHAFAMTSTAG